MRLLPTFLIRLSGFSFRRLERLRFSRTIEAFAAGDARALPIQFEQDLEEARQTLRAELADPKLEEAIFLESRAAHSMLKKLGLGPRNSKARQREQTAMMYLQRFCAKNDTNSFFGPIGAAHFFSEERSGELSLEEDIAERKIYLSHWGARELITDRRLVPNPTGRFEDGRFTYCAMEHDAITFFHRSYRSIGWDGSMDEELIEELTELGALVEGEPAFGVLHPLPDPPAAIEQELEAFASGDLAQRISALARLESKFEALTGKPARRGAGSHYADRDLLHEDCYARIEAELGSETTAPLLASLETLARVAALPMDRVRARTLEWFRGRFGEERAVPALTVHRAFDEDRPHEESVTTPAIEAIKSAISDAIRNREGRIDPAAFAGAAADRSGWASADVMLLPKQEMCFVVGEMHGFFLLPTIWFDVIPAEIRERALTELRAALASLSGGRRTAEVLLSHQTTLDRRFPIADLDLELIGKSDRASIRFGDVDVALSEGRIRFKRAGEEILPLMAYGGYPFFSYLSPLAPMIDEFRGKFFPEELLPDEIRNRDAPRLSLDRVIFRRATWIRTAAEVALDAKRDLDRFIAAQDLRRELGAPRFVFVSFPGEQKPILLDFENLFLVEIFARRTRALPHDAKVRLSEMLPAPQHLFLEGRDGARAFELRLGLFG